MKAIIFIIFSYVPVAVSKKYVTSPSECRYIRSPTYIKTKGGCSDFCSSVISCKSANIYYLLPVGCHTEQDGKCPEADECHKGKTPPGDIFIGSEDDYKKEHGKERLNHYQKTKGSGSIQ